MLNNVRRFRFKLANVQKGLEVQTPSGLCLPTVKVHASDAHLRHALCVVALVASVHPGLVCFLRRYPHAGKCVKTIMDDTNPPLGYARFAPNGRYIMTCSLDSRIKLWDFDALKLLKTYDGEAPPGTAMSDHVATIVLDPDCSGVIVYGECPYIGRT